MNSGIFNGGTDDQFVNRFRSGYYFLKVGDNYRTGLLTGAEANAWSGISDRRRKEKLQLLDDKKVLQKLATVDYYSWNYKCQDPASFRH